MVNISALPDAAALDGTEVYQAFQAGNSNVKVRVLTGKTEITLKNVFLGVGSAAGNTTGHDNVFLGYESGSTNTTGNRNIFIGTQVGFESNGNRNVFIGHTSGRYNTTGTSNVFTGYRSGFSNDTGYSNVFLGYNSGAANSSGHDNTFVGRHAGLTNSTGSLNILIGSGSYAPTDSTDAYLNIGDVIKGDMAAGPIQVVPLLQIATHTPSGPSDTGVAGTIAWDGTHIWVCVATDTWKSVELYSGSAPSRLLLE